MESQKCGLVMTAGGARGAYQAGVLKRVGEIPFLKNRPSPFPIITGASAGAINGAALAAGSSQFGISTEFLAALWGEIRTEDVYRTDVKSMALKSGQILRDISFGGMFGGGQAQSFLDATPLRNFLLKHLPFERIPDAIQEGHLYALAVVATNYYSGKSFIFIQGQNGHPVWEKSRKKALVASLTVDHICASAAIPVIFQPVMVPTSVGDFYFGDGGLRLTAPIGPAIRLGADRIFAVGIRDQKATEERTQEDLLSVQADRIVMKKPPLAQVMGVILNSIFLDHLDTDVEHLTRVNEMIDQSQHLSVQNGLSLSEPMKPIVPLVINPSIDIGHIADLYAEKMPLMVRYFLDGLGGSRSESADLMSYLLFDRAYTQDLIQLGYQDAQDRIDEIEQFLLAGRNSKLNQKAS